MENQRKSITGSDTGNVIVKTGSLSHRKPETDEPLPEKEYTNAEPKDLAEQKTIYINKPHMLFK